MLTNQILLCCFETVASLVPRPFPPPVFDRILYAKTEGEGLGERVMCVMSGRHEGKRRGGRCLTKNLEVFLVQELETVIFKRQCQYSSLSGRLEADQHRVCELQ